MPRRRSARLACSIPMSIATAVADLARADGQMRHRVALRSVIGCVRSSGLGVEEIADPLERLDPARLARPGAQLAAYTTDPHP